MTVTETPAAGDAPTGASSPSFDSLDDAVRALKVVSDRINRSEQYLEEQYDERRAIFRWLLNIGPVGPNGEPPAQLGEPRMSQAKIAELCGKSPMVVALAVGKGKPKKAK